MDISPAPAPSTVPLTSPIPPAQTKAPAAETPSQPQHNQEKAENVEQQINQQNQPPATLALKRLDNHNKEGINEAPALPKRRPDSRR
jgi:hypothetical protein